MIGAAKRVGRPAGDSLLEEGAASGSEWSVRFFEGQRRREDERLLWSRDVRFTNRLAQFVPGARVLDLGSGTVIIAAASALTDSLAAEVARGPHPPDYGLVNVDETLPERDRYVLAMSEAVQLSGLAERIGMAQTTQVVQTKMLDYFFSLKNKHDVHFQPIVELATGELHEYECLFRPVMPMLPQSISAIVRAAIDTDRSVELDSFIVARVLERGAHLSSAPSRLPERTTPSDVRFAINFTPASLLDPAFEASALADLVRSSGLEPRRITLECTEQQAVPDVVPLKKQVKALRRLGFGFAVDDAGAGYASFALIAALRPSIIKIDREIVTRIARDDAKQALVEAFVSFGRRIGARLLAEGIETRADLATLTGLGVDLGQGFLLGRPSAELLAPRAVIAPAAKTRPGRPARLTVRRPARRPATST
ncbi:MAG TPA: EAL domain-containing protein [Candidatus Limnocylindrales bacterium]|jgi:EAL domain-containing protein (putative c-di-GMP-specific phosphodiesterase class I)